MLTHLSLAIVLLAAPAPQAADPASVGGIVTALLVEARAIEADDQEPRLRPDYVKEVPPINDDTRRLLTRRLRAPVDRSPFVDAYVRWQLTGFELELPVETGLRPFSRWIEHLPALEANPRSEANVQRELLAVRGVTLTEPDQLRFRAALDELARRSSASRARNRPALALRRWIAGKLADHGEAALLIRLEACQALIRSGWDPQEIIEQIDACCARTAEVAPLEPASHNAVMTVATRLTSISTVVVQSAQLEGEIARVDVGLVTVRDFDVARWRRLLLRGRID